MKTKKQVVLKTIVRNWKLTVQYFKLAKQRKNRCLLVKYENFISDPNKTIEQIAQLLNFNFETEKLLPLEPALLGLNDNDNHANLNKPIGSIQKSKGNLITTKEKEFIQKQLGVLLMEYEYYLNAWV